MTRACLVLPEAGSAGRPDGLDRYGSAILHLMLPEQALPESSGSRSTSTRGLLQASVANHVFLSLPPGSVAPSRPLPAPE